VGVAMAVGKSGFDMQHCFLVCVHGFVSDDFVKLHIYFLIYCKNIDTC